MPRGIVTDLLGKTFGNLLVIARDRSDAQNNATWLCRCDCGTVVSLRVGNLRRGQRFCSKTCPLYQKHARLDLTGKRFGKLTAVYCVGMQSKSGKAIWLFTCECGGSIETVADNVMNENTQSCGCFGVASRIKHGLSKTREYHNEASRRWAQRNPAKVLALVYQRKADFRKRVPKWLTEEHWERINAFYLEAARLTRETGIAHHVDHIYPLRGKTVSGLHVPWNLQVITGAENVRKQARLPDDVCWTNGNKEPLEPKDKKLSG